MNVIALALKQEISKLTASNIWNLNPTSYSRFPFALDYHKEVLMSGTDVGSNFFLRSLSFLQKKRDLMSLEKKFSPKL